MKRSLTPEAINDLNARLQDIGIDAKLTGDISADLGDLRDAIALIADSYRQIATGRPPGPLLDLIESEARDHMRGHVRSLFQTVAKIRRQWKGATRHADRDD